MECIVCVIYTIDREIETESDKNTNDMHLLYMCLVCIEFTDMNESNLHVLKQHIAVHYRCE